MNEHAEPRASGWPAAQNIDEAVTDTGNASSEADLPINILIVDDEPKNLTVLESVLDDPSYRLIKATSADEALLALLAEEFALLILDIRMPDVTGFELAKMIKERKKTSQVPIIYLTAYYSEDQHVLAGYGAGAVDYLHKPVSPAILRSKVAIFVELYRKQREVAITNRALLAEMREHRKSQQQLHELNNTLEERVNERTKALHESQARLLHAADAARLTYVEMDYTQGRVRAANNFSDVMGYPLSEENLLDVHKSLQMLAERVSSEDSTMVKSAFKELLSGANAKIEYRLVGDDQMERHIESILSSTFGQDGKILQTLITNRDVTERKRAEEHKELLMAEVNHRARNLLAVVQAIVHQTVKNGDPATFALRLTDRIAGLAACQDLLVKSQWQGIELSNLIQNQLAHFRHLIGTRVLLNGPPARLTPSAAQGIGMALHEMGTNAAKYGALSNLDGQVRITWGVDSVDASTFTLHWIEAGGPKVASPTRKGFGQMVFGPMAEAAVDGKAEIDYAESGMTWKLTALVSNTLEVAIAASV